MRNPSFGACALTLLFVSAWPRQVSGHPSAADLRWLDRVTYGVNASTLATFERLGRRRFLEAQLRGEGPALPAAIAAQIDPLEITRRDGASLLLEVSAAQKRITGLTSPAEKEAERKLLNERATQLAYEAARRHVLRAIYGSDQLREQLVWFWLNHFSVYAQKANVRWTVADYEERAIRPHVLGRFRDLVLATLTHPAMLQDLDNAQNAKGHLNENYARELLELHTLGVDGGYTQGDVQELARVLTGAGIDQDGQPPNLKPACRPWRCGMTASSSTRPPRSRRQGAARPAHRRGRVRRRSKPRSTSSPGSPRARASSLASWRSTSWATSRRARWWTPWPRYSRARTAIWRP